MSDETLFTRRDFLFRLSVVPVGALLPAILSNVACSQSSSSQAILSASMWTYLWDIVDEGYDVVLGRLKENGLTSVSVAAAYHAGKFLAPHNPMRKVVFLEDGTVYFNPHPKLYGRIKPLVNSLVAKGHSIDRVKHHASALDLDTRAWVVCCHNTPLGMKHPEIVCRDVFGDPIYHNLCPSNPHVRRYLAALVKDISSRGIGTIELEAMQFQGYAHGFHHESEGITLPPPVRFFLGVCFCASCREAATASGLDWKSIEKYTKSTLESYFADPEQQEEQLSTMNDLPGEMFNPMYEWRKSVIVSLAKELADSTAATLRPLVSLDPAARLTVGMDPAKVSALSGGVLVPGYVKDGNALRQPLAELLSMVGGKEVTVGFQVGLPESGGKKEFLDRMKTARALGISSFNFYNYGFIPLSHLAWIKEALS